MQGDSCRRPPSPVQAHRPAPKDRAVPTVRQPVHEKSDGTPDSARIHAVPPPKTCRRTHGGTSTDGNSQPHRESRAHARCKQSVHHAVPRRAYRRRASTGHRQRTIRPIQDRAKQSPQPRRSYSGHGRTGFPQCTGRTPSTPPAERCDAAAATAPVRIRWRATARPSHPQSGTTRQCHRQAKQSSRRTTRATHSVRPRGCRGRKAQAPSSWACAPSARTTG